MRRALPRLAAWCVRGDARSLHRADGRWRVETTEGPLDAAQAVVALGPFAPDLLAPLGIKLPLGLKRGYHRHYRPTGNAALARPVVDTDIGYCLAPMEQGIRLTTGAEFAPRDAPPTPVQFDRLLPSARQLFPLGEQAETDDVDGQPALLSGLAAGDRPRTGPRRPVARLWPCPLGIDARARHRTAPGRDDDGRDAVLRSRAVPGGAISGVERASYSLIVRTTLEVGRPSLTGPFTCFRIASS